MLERLAIAAWMIAIPWAHVVAAEFQLQTATPAAIPQVGRVIGASVFVRAGPGTQNPIVITLHDGDLIKAKGLQSGWLEIDWPQKALVWIAKETVELDPATHRGLTTTAPCYVRSQGSPRGPVLAKLEKGAQVTIRHEAGGWYKIDAPGSASAYISAKYVSLAATQPTPAMSAEEIKQKLRDSLDETRRLLESAQAPAPERGTETDEKDEKDGKDGGAQAMPPASVVPMSSDSK